jgi:hypothetical protein
VIRFFSSSFSTSAWDVGDALVHPGLVDVRHHDRHLELAGEEQRQLAGHQPRPYDADLRHGPRELAVRCAGGTLGPALHEIQERVNRGAELVGLHEVRQRLTFEFGGFCLAYGPVGFQNVEDLGRGRRGVGGLGFHEGTAGRNGPGPALGNLRSGRVDGVGALRRDGTRDDFRGPGEGLLDEVGRLEQGVGHAQLVGLRACQGPVVAQRVLNHHLDGVFGPDQPRQDVYAAPAGDEADEGFRQRQRPGSGGHGAVGGLQGDLQAAAQRQAVDEGEAGDAEVGQGGVGLMAELGHPESVFPAAEGLDRGQVRPGDQEVRLAGDAHADNLAAGGTFLQPLQDRSQFHEGGGAQRGRFGVVQAVVQGDQGEDARALAVDGGQREVLDVRVGDRLVREKIGQFAEICGAHAAAPVSVVAADSAVSTDP